jgi:hypothetical protein
MGLQSHIRIGAEEHLSMEIQTSDLIAFTSLAVAIMAHRHSVNSSRENDRRVDKIVETYLAHSSSIALAEQSQKYVTLLARVNKDFEEIMDRLAYPALRASTRIGEVLDQFDNEQGQHPYLRHALNTAVEAVLRAYDRELTYQTGLNLASRLRELKHVRKDVASYEPENPPPRIVSFLRRRREPTSPEEKLSASPSYWESLKSLYARVPRSAEPELFRQVLALTRDFSELHKEARPRLSELEHELESALRENAFEMYELRKVPGLGPRFDRVKGDIDRVSELYFPDFFGIENFDVGEGIAYSLYAATVLYIVSQRFMWGRL